MSATGKNTILYTVGYIAKAVAGFFLLPIYANELGATEYGKMSLLTTVGTIIGYFMSLSTGRSVYRLYYDYKDDESRKRFLSTVFWTLALNGLFVGFLSICFSKPLSSVSGDVDVWKIFIPFIISTYISGIITYSQIIMQVEQKGEQFLLVSLLYVILYNVIVLLLVFNFSPTIESLVYSSLITNILLIPVICGRIRSFLKWTFDVKIIKGVFKFSLPMFGMVIADWGLSVSDRLFLANLHGLSDTGVYSIAATFVSVGTLFCASLYQAYGPLFYNTANNHEQIEARKLLYTINKFVTSSICLIYVGVALCTKFVQQLLFTSEYDNVAIYAYPLCLSGMIAQQCGLLNVMIYQNKKSVGLSLIAITGGVLSPLLNILMIPMIGPIAAALSNLMVSLFIFATTWWLSKRHYYIKLSYPTLLYGIFAVLCFCLLDNIIPPTGFVTSFLFKFLFVVVWFPIGLMLKLIDISYLNNYGLLIIKKVKQWRNKDYSSISDPKKYAL